MTDNLYIRACAVASSVENEMQAVSAHKCVNLCARRIASKYSNPIDLLLAIGDAELRFNPLHNMIDERAKLS